MEWCVFNFQTCQSWTGGSATTTVAEKECRCESVKKSTVWERGEGSYLFVADNAVLGVAQEERLEVVHLHAIKQIQFLQQCCREGLLLPLCQSDVHFKLQPIASQQRSPLTLSLFLVPLILPRRSISHFDLLPASVSPVVAFSVAVLPVSPVQTVYVKMT